MSPALTPPRSTACAAGSAAPVFDGAKPVRAASPPVCRNPELATAGFPASSQIAQGIVQLFGELEGNVRIGFAMVILWVSQSGGRARTRGHAERRGDAHGLATGASAGQRRTLAAHGAPSGARVVST